jgi:hypothetical protein
MSTNTTSNKNHTGAPQPTTATAINELDFSTNERQGEVFSVLLATLVFKGRPLHLIDPADGPATYWLERWVVARYLPTIDAARRLLEQIGGRL